MRAVAREPGVVDQGMRFASIVLLGTFLRVLATSEDAPSVSNADPQGARVVFTAPPDRFAASHLQEWGLGCVMKTEGK